MVGAAGLEPATTCLEGTQLLFPLTDLNLNAFCKQSQDQNVLGSGWTMYPVEASERGVDRAVSEISNRICSCLPRRGMSFMSIFQTTKPLVTPKVVAQSDRWVVEPDLQGHGSARLIRVTRLNPLPNSLETVSLVWSLRRHFKVATARNRHHRTWRRRVVEDSNTTLRTYACDGCGDHGSCMGFVGIT